MEEVYEYLKSKLNIFENNNLVVATSGGPDSMLLIYLLNKIRTNNEFNIVCAHVNHNTGRPGQLEEQKYVERFCRNHNIIFETMTIKDYGVREEDLESLAEKAMEDPCKPGNPREVSKVDFIELYKKAM